MSNIQQNSKIITDMIEAFAAAKNLSKAEVLPIIEKAVFKAWEVSYGIGYNLELEIKQNSIKLFRKLNIVNEIVDFKTEITDVKPDHDGFFREELPMKFSQNALKAAINEIQREEITLNKVKEYEEFCNHVGELFKCRFLRKDGNSIIVRVEDKYLGIIPDRLSVQNMKFSQENIILCRLHQVFKNFDSSTPQLRFDIKTNDYIKGIVKYIVPEIESGLVKIRSVGRAIGILTKVIVEGDSSCNAIGSCMGYKGQRRKDISNLLHGEKVEFILWAPDLNQRLLNCFTARHINVVNIISKINNSFKVVVSDNESGKFLTRSNVFLTKEILGISALEIIEETKYIEDLVTDLKRYILDDSKCLYLAQTHHKNLKAAFDDASLSDEDLNNLDKYLLEKENEELDEYIKLGGLESFFLSINGISSSIYFDLLKHDIKSAEDLLQFESADHLSEVTGLDRDLCVFILHNITLQTETNQPEA